MFLLIAIVAIIIRIIIGFNRDYKESKYNVKARTERVNERGTYYDRQGRERDAVTNEPRRTTTDSKRNQVLLDKYGHVVRNITEEKREAEFWKEYNNPNRTDTTFYWNPMDTHDDCPDAEVRDVWHIDFETKNIYVVKKITQYIQKVSGNSKYVEEITVECFMDIKTHKLVRATDNERKKHKEWRELKYGVAMTEDELQTFVDKANNKEGTFSIRPFVSKWNLGSSTGF